MKHIVFLILTILLAFPAEADEAKETCRSYIIVAPENTKHCLLDQDEKIAEFDKQLSEEAKVRDFKDSLKNDDVPPQQPLNQE